MNAPRVRLFHWRAAEAKPLIQELREAGYTVDYPGDKLNGTYRKMRDKPPVAALIDLTRMPSHGRYVAMAIRTSKALRHIPIVFVDGDPEKVERLKKEYPDATYSSREKLPAVLKRVRPVKDPVVPKTMISAPSDRTTAQKMGIREGMRVAVIDAPGDYARILGPLPEGAEWVEAPDEALPMTVWFAADADAYLTGLRRMRQIAGKSRLWVVYRKGQKDGLTQFMIRDAALAVGLVDYKICSVNEAWSGLLFTVKK